MPSERNPFSRKQKGVKNTVNTKVTNTKNSIQQTNQSDNKKNFLDKIKQMEKNTK